MRTAITVALCAVVAVLAAGCTGVPGYAAGPRFLVSGNPSADWEPVGIRVTALPPGARVSITANVRSGGLWSSQADYAVPPNGTVDLSRQAPIDGPFRGADGMGLFWSLRSANGAPATSEQTWEGGTQEVTLTAVVDGRRVARTQLVRVGLSAVAPSEAVFDDGISGDYFPPTTSSEGLRPAVLVFDGTDTGTSTGVLAAARLAAAGYPALAFSAYGSAGQPDPTRTLPAERLLSAIGWLRSQAGVDPSRIFSFGTSRGAALALWAAVAYPDLVYGAIAPAGTTGLICSSPVPAPAVTVGGSWVPCATGTREVTQANVLDLSRIQGPIVLGCAGNDEQLANGCAWMAAGRRARGERVDDSYLSARDATHLFYVPPYTPLYLPPVPFAQATENARVAFWAAVGKALTAPSTVPGH